MRDAQLQLSPGMSSVLEMTQERLRHQGQAGQGPQGQEQCTGPSPQSWCPYSDMGASQGPHMWPSLEGGASGTAGWTAADGAVGPALSPSGLGLEGSSCVDPLESGLVDLWGDLGHLFHGLWGWRAGGLELSVVTHGPVHRACCPVRLGHRLHCSGGTTPMVLCPQSKS